MEKHNMDDIVKKFEKYLEEVEGSGFENNDYTLDDMPYVFGQLSELDILPKGPYVQVTSDDADCHIGDKTKFLVFDAEDRFVTYLKETDVLKPSRDDGRYSNLTEEGFRLLAAAYLKGV